MSHETLLPADSRPRAQLRPTGTSFAGLVGVELRRIWWRRLTKAVIVAVVGFLGIATYAIYQQTNPEAIAQQVQDYQQLVDEMKKQNADIPAAEKERQIAECRQQQSESGGDFGCDQMFAAPSPEGFGLVNTARDALTRELAKNSVYLLGFLAFLLGASAVAAEFSAGTMSTWLTFAPRRLRVAAAKITAATTAGLGVGVLGVGLAVLGVIAVTTINRPDAALELPDAPPAASGSLTEMLVRVVAAVALGGLGGAVFGFLLRSTAGVIGLVFAYAIVVEGFVANVFEQGRLQPWLVRPNIDAFVNDGTTYFAQTCTSTGCDYSSHPLSYTHGWVYLIVLSVIGVAAALAAFRRRDVN